MARSRPLGIAALLVATTAWASLFLIGKPMLGQFDPVWFTFIRYSVAGAAFAALLRARGSLEWARWRAHAPQLALLGFVGYGVFGTLVLVGLAHSVPSHGAVIMATMPITTQLVRWAIEGIRPAPVVLAGTALALLGVVVVSGVLGGSGPAHASTAMGDFISWLATLCWVAYTRGSQRLAALDVLEFSGLTAIASWPLLLLAALAGTLTGWTPLPAAASVAGSWHALLYIGIVPSVVAILAFNFGVRTLGLVTGTAFLNFVPVSALLMSTALGAPPTARELVGVGMVVAALLMHTLAQRPAPAPRLAPSAATPAPR
jgi:drug/metabolite transporter (DMT)-like permease